MHTGVRGLEIKGKFKKFTAIGVYLEDTAVPFLAGMWKGMSVEELTDSVDFFRDIVIDLQVTKLIMISSFE